MARVLILTASYGSGHNIAARSLAAAFGGAGAAVRVVDHFRDLVHPAFERATRALYHATLRRVALAWGAAYGLADWMTSDSPLAFGMTRLGAPRLARLLAAETPDVVVSVHATPAVVMTALARRGVRVPPHTTVVTDFVAHSQWIAPGVERYCVAADEVKHEFIARGIPPGRVIVTGLPLRPEFDEAGDRATAREALGLDPRRPVVLAMAGAHGALGRLSDVTRALTRVAVPLQGLVVAGRDAALETRLGRLAAGSPVRVVGHAANVRQLMAAADLLVTKAGGMTLAEAMAAGLPVVAYGSLPGQERRNERFASRCGVALVARSRRDLDRALERALTEPRLLERLRRPMRRLYRPGASRRVVSAVLERVAIAP
ncbi:MAG: MGDG synthase family glycosyltransferase [Candidatus Rokuibacteriota bacterium]